MDKKEAKRLYLLKQLEDPNVSEFEKKSIRQRLGIKTVITKDDLIKRKGTDLISFTGTYLYDLLPVLRREKRTKNPLELFSETQKHIYYLSNCFAILDEDSLEQLEDVDDFSEVDGLIESLKLIGRVEDAELLYCNLKNGKITNKKINKVLDHFREDMDAIDGIEKDIESFILRNIEELIKLQNI